jgi:hypothetical protein
MISLDGDTVKFGEEDAIKMLGYQTMLHGKSSKLIDITDLKCDRNISETNIDIDKPSYLISECFESTINYVLSLTEMRKNKFEKIRELVKKYPNFWIAGSSVLCNKLHRGFWNDIDIFITSDRGPGKDPELDYQINDFVAQYANTGIYTEVVHTSYAISFYIGIVSVQIIKKVHKHPSEIINNFDIVPSMFLTDGERIYTNYCGLMFAKTNIFPLNNRLLNKGSIRRIFKYVTDYCCIVYLPGARTVDGTLFDKHIKMISSGERLIQHTVVKDESIYMSGLRVPANLMNFVHMCDQEDPFIIKWINAYNRLIRDGYTYYKSFGNKLSIGYDELYRVYYNPKYYTIHDSKYYNADITNSYTIKVPQIILSPQMWSIVTMLFFTKVKGKLRMRLKSKWILKKILTDLMIN